MNFRQQQEELEKQILSPYACLSSQSRGRKRPVEECPIRTVFQRDRDRIIHCKSYRRLMHKTQVFLSPEGDHYRTRLTHTLEVVQIARTIARALRLNEDLTEAIAQGHDLGHTPFGHAGERALNEVCPKGYEHSAQSVRVVERLENGGKGLNLNWEVVNGIACHSSSSVPAKTLEGRVVRYADKIAYMNHDIEDAIRAGILSDEEIPWDLKYVLGRTKSQRITTFLTDIIQNSGEDVVMSPPVQEAYHKLRSFLFEAVYTNPQAKGEEGKAMDIVKRLYAYFQAHPERMPQEYMEIARQEGADQGACDYISGMSDRYAVGVFTELFIPKSWGG